MSKCTRLGTFAQNEAADRASSALRSAAMRASHVRKRVAALQEVARWPQGATAMAGLSSAMLEGLCTRGLVERRYVITRDGRAEIEAAR